MPTGKNGNGLTLLEHFIPDGLSHAATAFVESLKINSMSEERRGQWLPFYDLLYQGLCRSRCGRRTQTAAGCSKRSRPGLVERSNEFRQEDESETATRSAAQRHRQTETSSAHSQGARSPKAACFDDLPRYQSGNADRQIAHARDDGNRESSFAGNAEKIAHSQVAAFLHPESAGNNKECRANR